MYCFLCGKENKKKFEKISKNRLWPNLRLTHCRKCFPLYYKNGKKPDIDHVFCVSCGTKIYWQGRRPVRWTCNNCDPASTKQNAHYLMNKHPEKIRVLKKCDCTGRKRVRHHPDYSKPFDIYDLCYPCHALEHQRIKREKSSLT